MSGDQHYVYILKCKDNTYYTGYAKDVKQRLELHNEGKGAKYTRGRGPHELVYSAPFPSKGDALRKEYEIKQLTRKQKESLIAEEGRKKHATNTEEL